MASLLIIGCGGSGHAPKSSSTPTPSSTSNGGNTSTDGNTSNGESALPPSASSAPVTSGELEEYDSVAETSAKANLKDATFKIGNGDNTTSIAIDEDGTLTDSIKVPADAKVEDYYNPDLSSLTFDKDFDWSPADLIVTIKDGDDSIDVKLKNAEIRVVDGQLETKLLKDITEVISTDVLGGEETIKKAKIKEEAINKDLKIDIAGLLDNSDASEADIQDTKDKLQAYLDDKGKSYDFTMKVNSSALSMPDITGQLKTD